MTGERNGDQNQEQEQIASNYAAFLNLARSLHEKGIPSLSFDPYREYDKNHSVRIIDISHGLNPFWDLLRGSDEWLVQVMGFGETPGEDIHAALVLENWRRDKTIFMLRSRFEEPVELEVLATRKLESHKGELKGTGADIEDESEHRLSEFILNLAVVYASTADKTPGAMFAGSPEISGALGIRPVKEPVATAQ